MGGTKGTLLSESGGGGGAATNTTGGDSSGNEYSHQSMFCVERNHHNINTPYHGIQYGHQKAALVMDEKIE